MAKAVTAIEERVLNIAKQFASATPAVQDSPITFREEVLMILAIRAMRMEIDERDRANDSPHDRRGGTAPS